MNFYKHLVTYILPFLITATLLFTSCTTSSEISETEQLAENLVDDTTDNIIDNNTDVDNIIGQPPDDDIPALKSLTAAETQQLTGYLEELSRSWHQSSVDAANGILSDESLGLAVWESFFQEYFSEHYFTDDLRNYLGYPVFWWFSDTVHANLQQGLYESLTDIINRESSAYLESDKSSVTRDSPIVQSIINAHRFLSDMIRLHAPSVEYQDDIFKFYNNLVEDSPLIYGTALLDVKKFPFAGAFRAQAYMNLVNALELTEQVRDQVIDMLELTGIKKDIFFDHGVLIIDNQGLDIHQFEVIKSILNLLPSKMHNLTSITVNEFLGNTDDKSLWFVNKAGVNIFGVRIGGYSENPFPSDVLPSVADGFYMVVVHEVNHVVDAYYVKHTNRRRNALIEAAGPDNMNYLRSMFDDGFFIEAPQEFFASIANQWFADSEKTIQLGLVRFDEGYKGPINQALFFADVYSLGGDFTLFYTLDTSGKLTRTQVPIIRDSQGRITEIHVVNDVYKFQLDENGNVMGVSW